MQQQTKIELASEPNAFNPLTFRAQILRDGETAYLSQRTFLTHDEAQRYAALVFAGQFSGYRF